MDYSSLEISCPSFRIAGPRRKAVGIVLLALCLLYAGCDGLPSAGDLDVWVVSDMHQLTDNTAAFRDDDIVAEDNKTVRLFSAANETVGFQLVLDAGALGSVSDITINFNELETTGNTRKPIPQGAFRGFRMLPVPVKDFPAWYLRLVPAVPAEANYYDPLVPLDMPGEGQPFDLPRGKRLAVWVDLAVPADTFPGTYTGEIEIDTYLWGGETVPIEVRVYDFVLPETKPLATVGGFNHLDIFRRFIRRDGKPYEPIFLDPERRAVADGLNMVRDLAVIGHRHRLDLFDRELHPKIKRDLQGNIHLDWSGYDAVAAPCVSGTAFADRIGASAWPLPITDRWPVPHYYGGIHTEQYASVVRRIVSLSGDHLRSLGGADAVFAWPCRGRIDEQRYARFVRLSGLIRSADPKIPILTRLPFRPPAQTGWKVPVDFSALADIVSPPAHWLQPSGNAPNSDAAGAPAGVWISPGRPPYLPCLSILATPSGVRAIPWFAAKYGVSGLLFPDVLNWRGDIYGAPKGAETRLFYPGDTFGVNTILPSVRLKRLRRGLQDIAYINLLRVRGENESAQRVMNALVRYAGLEAVGDNYLDPRIGGWVEKGSAWIAARRILAEKVSAAVHPNLKNASDHIADRVRWARFTEGINTIDVERMTAQVHAGSQERSADIAGGAADTGAVRARLRMDLYNSSLEAVDCRLRVHALPPNWHRCEDQTIVSALAPGAKRVAEMEITGPSVPVDIKGHVPVGVEVSVDQRVVHRVRGQISFVTAPRCLRPPRIDGRLDDWPSKANNAAGDFRLLGRRGRTKNGLADRQTVVFVMHDERYIYFGFLCMEPDLSGMTIRNDNRIHYEQLLACGEDLVEMIIDPGSTASAPEGLFHIVVKPNGVSVQQLGIGSDPPLGIVRPFPLGADVSVARKTKAWTVEMRIPRAAFGADGESRFWGINFARYASQSREASNWAGAERYYYNPDGLGTLYIPDATRRVNPR